MSKREQFKSLLKSDDKLGTGSSQKTIILDQHLIGGNTNGLDQSTGDIHKGATGEHTMAGNNEVASAADIVNEILHSSNPSSQQDELVDHQELKDHKEQTHDYNLNESFDVLLVKDTHVRRTYLIERELLMELEFISKGKKKGYKNKLINSGLQMILDLVKQNKGEL